MNFLVFTRMVHVAFRLIANVVVKNIGACSGNNIMAFHLFDLGISMHFVNRSRVISKQFWVSTQVFRFFCVYYVFHRPFLESELVIIDFGQGLVSLDPFLGLLHDVIQSHVQSPYLSRGSLGHEATLGLKMLIFNWKAFSELLADELVLHKGFLGPDLEIAGQVNISFEQFGLPRVITFEVVKSTQRGLAVELSVFHEQHVKLRTVVLEHCFEASVRVLFLIVAFREL